MGGYWGINRTMAEIHALLFVTRQSLCTDDIMERLKISRGNASMNLRALVDWGLIERVHKIGDRKEYFQADTDVWHMFETIMRERRRREVEPVITTIDRCREMVAGRLTGLQEADPKDIKEYRRRLDELRNFLATMGTLFELVVRFGDAGIGKLTRLLSAPAGRRTRARGAAGHTQTDDEAPQ
jgi:DNA-binding transcriptional regulator GbsR (MarR family)